MASTANGLVIQAIGASRDRIQALEARNTSLVLLTNDTGGAVAHGDIVQLSETVDEAIEICAGPIPHIVDALSAPGGDDKDIQFNDGGVFGGEDSFEFDKTVNEVTITGAVDGLWTAVTALNTDLNDQVRASLLFATGALADGFRLGINGQNRALDVGGGYGPNYAFIWQEQNAPITFGTSDATRMVLSTAGHLLIGSHQVDDQAGEGLLQIGPPAGGTTKADGIFFQPDANLYRSGASMLKTDDSLTIAGQLTILGGTPAAEQALVSDGAGLGSWEYAYGKAYVQAGAPATTWPGQLWMQTPANTFQVRDAVDAAWIPVSGAGEVNTASNTGSAGTGIYKQKVGVDLEFYKIHSLNALLTVALVGVDYLGLTVNQGSIDHDALLNFVAGEHLAVGAIDHNLLLNYVAARHIDWTNANNAFLNTSSMRNDGGVVFNEGGLSTSDFRVEGDTNVYLLFADADVDRVAIGTSSTAGGRLTVDGSTVMPAIYGSSAQVASSAISGYATGASSTGVRGETTASAGVGVRGLATSGAAVYGIASGANGIGISGTGGAGGFDIYGGGPSSRFTGDVVILKSLIVNEDSHDLDTRFEGNGDANLLYLDAGSDYVGIGTNAPGAKLDVHGDLTVESANGRVWGIVNLAAGHTVHFQYGGDAFNEIECAWGGVAYFKSFHGTVIQNYLVGAGASDPALTVIGHSSQDIQEWYNNTPTLLMELDSGGDLWVLGDVSALTFTDRTPFFIGDALSDIRKIKGDRSGIDHRTLPEAVRAAVLTATGESVDGRNLSAMVSMLTVAIQQLLSRVELLEAA